MALAHHPDHVVFIVCRATTRHYCFLVVGSVCVSLDFN